MLILHRGATESIVIGDNIYVTVLHIGNDSVKLGIDAPKNMAIDRQEVRERKKREDRRY